MNELCPMKPDTEKSTVIPELRFGDITIQLSFSTEPNQKAPALIRELLRNSYLNRLSSKSRCEQ